SHRRFLRSLDHRCRRSPRRKRRHVRNRRASALVSGRQSPGLRLSVWVGNRNAHLLHHFPLMLLFLVLCPIVAAILIIGGTPARLTALIAAAANLFVTLLVFMRFDRVAGGFQFVTSFVVSTDWRIHFALGVDGLSLLMLLLATIVTLAAVWFADKIENYGRAF